MPSQTRHFFDDHGAIMGQVKQEQFQLACSKHFEATHPGIEKMRDEGGRQLPQDGSGEPPERLVHGVHRLLEVRGQEEEGGGEGGGGGRAGGGGGGAGGFCIKHSLLLAYMFG